MLPLLLVAPWLLTVIVLLAIMFFIRKKKDVLDNQEVPHTVDEDGDAIRVAIYEDKAYWVYKNVFYEADTTREPDWSTAHPIDTMEMSEKQLNYLLKVLDDLQEEERE